MSDELDRSITPDDSLLIRFSAAETPFGAMVMF